MFHIDEQHKEQALTRWNEMIWGCANAELKDAVMLKVDHEAVELTINADNDVNSMITTRGALIIGLVIGSTGYQQVYWIESTSK